MHTRITLKNYRCFSDEHPAIFELRPGFTAFIGINNAGKSTILRFLYEFRHVFEDLADSVIDRIAHNAPSSDDPRMGMRFPVPTVDASAIYHDFNNRDLQIDLEVMDLPTERESPTNPIYHAQLRSGRQRSGEFVVRFLRNGQKIDYNDFSAEEIAIRGWLLSLANALYIGPFRNTVNSGSDSAHFDLKVGSAFVDQWRRWQSSGNRQSATAIGRLTSQIGSLFDIPDLQITPLPDNSTLQIFSNGNSYLLTDVGAGLAETIIILANAAVKNPDYILIDEPELHLHPALQLKFLTTLGSYAKQGTLFATHTIGLARSSAERIYTVRREQHTHSTLGPYEKTANLSELLGELSFAGLQENGYDQIVLVEGPTEVKTMLQLLRHYGKDLKTVLVPLGGGNLIARDRKLELTEVSRLAPKMYALIDSERAAAGAPLDPARQEFVDDCRAAGIPCTVLERRALENYFPERAIQAVKGAKYRALSEYEVLKNAPLSWGKPENWLIAQHMTEADLAGTDLGQFLQSL